MQELWPNLTSLDKTIIAVDIERYCKKCLRESISPSVAAVKMVSYIDQEYINEEENDYADFVFRLFLGKERTKMEDK